MSSEAVKTLISELMSSKCDGDRTRTRSRFEEQNEVIDAKLSHLIKFNKTNLSNTLLYTAKTIQVVSNSKAKCQAIKERLTSCREILQCKRDELRGLWLESLQHRYAHQLLEEIENLRKTPEMVNESLMSKKYLHATETLVSSIHLLEAKLSDTEGLKDLRVELHRLLDKLYFIFLEELSQELYMSTFHSIYQGTYNSSFEDITYEKVFNSRNLKDSTKSIKFNTVYVSTLLQCISLLRKVPETLEILKEECQDELMKIVYKLSKLMYDIIQRSTDTPVLDLPNSQGLGFLIDLLETIIGHFRQIIINNKIFLHILGKTTSVDSLDKPSYETVDIYSNIQATIEHFVTCYLEIQSANTTTRQNTSVFSNQKNITDVSAFFVLRNRPESKSQTLFNFRNSAQGMIANKKRAPYGHQQQARETQLKNSTVEVNMRKLVLVCKPSLRNITIMFDPLKNFVWEIEKALDIDLATHCPLHAFVYDCANNFLDQVNSEMIRILETASLNLESWTVSVVVDNSPDSERSCPEKQILTSTLILNDNLKELQKLLSNLPDYSNHFLQLIHYVILDYKELVHKVFKSLFGEEQNILSVSWAKDRDIRRLLKSFSNWKYLEINESGEMIESPEDIRLRNKEESELLIRNLHSEEHPSWEIIKDCSVLFNLAVLQESLQWFSRQLITFVEDFKNFDAGQNISEGTSELHAWNAVKGLQKLVKEYEDFSDVCLLALHLEVRAHCFHFLLPLSHGEISQEIEVCARNLTEDLMKIDETLVPVLTPKELKYVFEGVGELIASILIQSVSRTTNMTESLVKRMYRSLFAVQCCLGNITMTREVSLERARQYIQLLNRTCDEILNEIVEEGARFKIEEYVSIFRILLDREGADLQSLSNYEVKLQKIFKTASS